MTYATQEERDFHAKMRRQKQMQRRKQLHDEFYADKRCEWCGSTEELQLHHVDPSQKDGEIGWSWNKERRDLEIAKCIVLCKKCHFEYHASINTVHGSARRYEKGCRCEICVQKHKSLLKKTYKVIEHGTSAMYKKGCRCEICTEAKARWYREFREKKAEALGLPLPERRHVSPNDRRRLPKEVLRGIRANSREIVEGAFPKNAVRR
jgi:hypothetical protein